MFLRSKAITEINVAMRLIGLYSEFVRRILEGLETWAREKSLDTEGELKGTFW